MKIMASTQAIADDGRRFIDTRTAAPATRKMWAASASNAMVSGRPEIRALALTALLPEKSRLSLG